MGRSEMGRPAGIEIVRRACEFWERSGKPEGRDQEFYHCAERELQDEDAPSLGTPDQPLEFAPV
jgi:hypothetical protein